MTETNVVKRAYEIAPTCQTIEELKRRLISEGFEQVNAHLSTRQLRRELLVLIRKGNDG